MSRNNEETLEDVLGMPVFLIFVLFIVITVASFFIFNSCRPGEIAGIILVSIMIGVIGTFLLVLVNRITLQ